MSKVVSIPSWFLDPVAHAIYVAEGQCAVITGCATGSLECVSRAATNRWEPCLGETPPALGNAEKKPR